MCKEERRMSHHYCVSQREYRGRILENTFAYLWRGTIARFYPVHLSDTFISRRTRGSPWWTPWRILIWTRVDCDITRVCARVATRRAPGCGNTGWTSSPRRPIPSTISGSENSRACSRWKVREIAPWISPRWKSDVNECAATAVFCFIRKEKKKGKEKFANGIKLK